MADLTKDYTTKITWTPHGADDRWFVREVVSSTRGFIEWGPMPRATITPFIEDRKAYWTAIHRDIVEQHLKILDHTFTRFDLPVYARGVVGDEAASKSAAPKETAGKTPEPVARGAAEPHFHPCRCGMMTGTCTC